MEHAEQVPKVEELVFHGVVELESAACGERAISVLRDCCRRARSGKAVELPRLQGCPAFALDCDGEAKDAWPDNRSNALQQNLARRFLDLDDLCASTDDSPRLYRMNWTAMAIEASEYLLVCPYGGDRAGGPAAGVIVLCVTSLLYGGEKQ